MSGLDPEKLLEEALLMSGFWTDRLAKTRDTMTLEEETHTRMVAAQCSLAAIAAALALIAERLNPDA